MKKILIISYFFPPGNFAGSYRVKAWADYLHLFGYYPIIVTRHWNENETDYTGISPEKEIRKETHKHYTLYRVPFKGSIRDRLVKRFGVPARIPGKIFSFFQLLAQNFFLKCIPYHNLYEFSREILLQEKGIKTVIISGNPFHQFRFGYLLKEDFPSLKWIADYRDEWTSYPKYSKRKDPFWKKIFLLYDGIFEKRWVNQADMITSVSKIWLDQIREYLKFKGRTATILNGYDPADFKNHDWSKALNNKNFSILYSGTIYPFQELSIILGGLRKFLENNEMIIHVDVIFAGLNSNRKTHDRIKMYFKGYEKNLKILPRISKTKFLDILHQSSILLIFPYTNVPGCYSSKIFEYLASKRPILMAPADGFISKLIEETNSGFVANSIDEVSSYLSEKYGDFINNKSLLNLESSETFIYSRVKQAELLADQINILENE